MKMPPNEVIQTAPTDPHHPLPLRWKHHQENLRVHPCVPDCYHTSSTDRWSWLMTAMASPRSTRHWKMNHQLLLQKKPPIPFRSSENATKVNFSSNPTHPHLATGSPYHWWQLNKKDKRPPASLPLRIWKVHYLLTMLQPCVERNPNYRLPFQWKRPKVNFSTHCTSSILLPPISPYEWQLQSHHFIPVKMKPSELLNIRINTHITSKMRNVFLDVSQN